MGIYDNDNKEYIDFFNKLDRREFVSDDLKALAELDFPLSIGYGQTISQPTLVLEMTILLDLNSGFRVLEIGTGSGYQTAFLAHFSREVFTIEIYEELSKRAQKALSKLSYDNIHFKIGDGSSGWVENAPYDRIMVTAAAGKLPYNLIDQLKPGGKLMVPYGPRASQDLILITKDENGKIATDVIDRVRFVEFVGEYGWSN